MLTVSETTNNQIHMYGSDGSEFRTLGGSGAALGKLSVPIAFDVFEQFSDLAGNLFIADYGNNRIQRWNTWLHLLGRAANGGAPGGAGQHGLPRHGTPPRQR